MKHFQQVAKRSAIRCVLRTADIYKNFQELHKHFANLLWLQTKRDWPTDMPTNGRTDGQSRLYRYARSYLESWPYWFLKSWARLHKTWPRTLSTNFVLKTFPLHIQNPLNIFKICLDCFINTTVINLLHAKCFVVFHGHSKSLTGSAILSFSVDRGQVEITKTKDLTQSMKRSNTEQRFFVEITDAVVSRCSRGVC